MVRTASVIAGAALLACASSPPVDPTQPEAAALLSRAIRFPTVDPPGGEEPLAVFLVERLAAAGLEAMVVPTPGEGRAAAWARLPGRGTAAPLVLLSHLDVVPADREEWTVDPYAGVIRDGFVWGRGAQDAKGVAIVHVLALLELARSGAPLERDVIFLATPGEETGGSDGAGWIVRERPDLLGGARFLLTEGGGVLRYPGGRSAWLVAVTEKTPCWLRLVAEGPPGHSSVPPRDAAVPKLLAALARVEGLEHRLRVLPEVARMFAALAPLAPPEHAAGFADLAGQLARDAEFRQRFLAEPAYAALVSDTLSVTVLEGGSRTNVLPAQASAHLDARLLPGGRCSAFSQHLAHRVAAPGVRVEPLLAFAGAGSSPVDDPLYRAIERLAARVEPDSVVVPHVVAGFTDAHYFRSLGIASYGFVPRWHDLGDPRGVHGPDERISIENLERGVTTLVELLRELDSPH